MSNVFEHILGHEAQCRYMETVLKNGHFAHAYCFSGPEMVGKTTMARRFIAGFLDVPETALSAHPNVCLVERQRDEKSGKRERHISVKAVRSLREQVGLSGFGSGRKAVLIRDADSMTLAAQNALLKTLEEPSGEVLIVLVARDASRLLPTILSRVVHMRFRLVAREVICSALRDTLGQEKAHELAGLAAGRPGLAMRLQKEHVYEERQQAIEQACAFLRAPLATQLQEIETLVKSRPARRDVRDYLGLYRLLLHDILLSSASCEHLLAVSQHREELSAISQEKSPVHWAALLRLLNDAEQSIEKNGNISLALESFALGLDS